VSVKPAWRTIISVSSIDPLVTEDEQEQVLAAACADMDRRRDALGGAERQVVRLFKAALLGEELVEVAQGLRVGAAQTPGAGAGGGPPAACGSLALVRRREGDPERTPVPLALDAGDLALGEGPASVALRPISPARASSCTRAGLSSSWRVASSVVRQTQPNDLSPIGNVPVAGKTPYEDAIDAYNERSYHVLSATTMLLFGDSSFGSVGREMAATGTARGGWCCRLGGGWGARCHCFRCFGEGRAQLGGQAVQDGRQASLGGRRVVEPGDQAAAVGGDEGECDNLAGE